MKKEWVKLKTAVNMAAAMEVLTQSFTFKVFASFKLVILTSPGFCLQQKQQPSFLDFTNIRKWRYSHNPKVFFLKRATKYFDISHQDHKMDKEEDKYQTQK